ncbi:MAG: DUF839 domain-containing protein [Marinobacter sp.]|uniref:PhoX family protein n=1 Tax=Marinobacter sp. TaxID=50741 RepID=UPI00396E11D8
MNTSTRVLCTPTVLRIGATYNSSGNRPSDEVRKEIGAHGVSVVHIKQDSNGTWDTVFGSPFNPESTPQTRTALGRFGHEGVIFAPVKEGQPVVCYSGDDFRFNEDGTGEWLPLDLDNADFAANPIANNQNGHIIRWMEAGNDHGATSFDWDIFVFAGLQGTETVVEGDAVVTLNDDNIFNSPDGLWFDYNGRLWIQTDGRDEAPYQNNMMLAANPETREIKRFFVGPVGCEVTGVVTTPDVKTMFVNIQHPDGNWPDSSDPRPRDATVIVTRDDGGVIGA